MQKTIKLFSKRVQYAALISILAFFSLSAHATPVVWYLSGVTFIDGGAASGSFTYDADTNTYSAISISTTAGSIITTAMSYDITSSGIGCGTSEVVCLLNSAHGPDYIGDLGLTLYWHPGYGHSQLSICRPYIYTALPGTLHDV